MNRRKRALAGCAPAAVASFALAVAVLAGPAQADHTATDFTLSPASPEAGASVNASSWTTLSYRAP